jgi:hypothetical protein
MEVITEYGNYWDLKDHSWSGALDTLADIEKADKEDELMQHLEEVFMDRTPTDTEINDYLWHDRQYVYEAVGLNENGEIPTVFDEVQEDTLVNELDLENMKKSEIFSESILSDLEEQINSNQTGLGHLLKEDIETEEQAEWVRDNL